MLTLAAVLLAVVTAFAVVLLPLGRTETVTFTGDGPATVETSHTSLLDSDGPGALAVALMPAVIAALPLPARSRGARRQALVISAVLLGGFVVLASASIGLAYLPTLMVIIAALVSARKHRALLPQVASVAPSL